MRAKQQENEAAWQLVLSTPTITERELELYDRIEQLRDAAESATAGSLNAARALERSYEVEVIDDLIETARRHLTAKELRIFEALQSFEYSGTFQQLRDMRPGNGVELWPPLVNDTSIERALKRLRAKLPAQWSFVIHNDFRFTWKRRPDRKKS